MTLLSHIAIAFDAIRANPIRAFLTTLGVLIGVLSIILLVGLGDAVRGYVLEEFAGIGSNVVQVRAGRQETRGMGHSSSIHARNRLTMDDFATLERRGLQLVDVSPVVFSTAELRVDDLKRDVMALGIGPAYANIRNLRVSSGRFISAEDLDGRHKSLVIGQTIVRELFGSAANPVGKTVYISSTPFRVVGVTERKGKTFGFDMDDLAFVPATALQDLFGLETVSEIAGRARDRAAVAPAIEEIGELLAIRRNGVRDFTIYSQDDMMETIDNIMDTLTFFLGAIASISLLVGGIGIMNIMLVSVKERTREIGVRRAVGARRRDILLQFLVESVVISVLGGVMGLLLGFVGVRIAAHIEPALPVSLSLWNVLMALGFSIAVGVASGVFPAMRAADLDPVEALRYE